MNKQLTQVNYTHQELIELFSSFIKEKGICIEERTITGVTFFPGIEICNGCLIIDREKLLYPGDLLHEAGHIAVAPVEDRKTLSNNVTENRPGTEGEEMSVMLWTYAACLHLSISPAIVFHADGYKGESDWIVNQYKTGNYVGLPLLVWMGLTRNPEVEKGYPEMIKWLRD